MYNDFGSSMLKIKKKTKNREVYFTMIMERNLRNLINLTSTKSLFPWHSYAYLFVGSFAPASVMCRFFWVIHLLCPCGERKKKYRQSNVPNENSCQNYRAQSKSSLDLLGPQCRLRTNCVVDGAGV